jgi:hypothetical protein
LNQIVGIFRKKKKQCACLVSAPEKMGSIIQTARGLMDISAKLVLVSHV